MIQSLDSLNLFDFPFELNLIKIKHLEILNVWFQKISIPPLQGRGGFHFDPPGGLWYSPPPPGISMSFLLGSPYPLEIPFPQITRLLIKSFIIIPLVMSVIKFIIDGDARRHIFRNNWQP